MSIELNHTIVPCHEEDSPDGLPRHKDANAQFYARILGLNYIGSTGHFVAVEVNDSLTFDFDNATMFMPHHYAFKVSEADFDDIFTRIKQENLPFGSEPFHPDNMDINHRNGGRGLYFSDPNSHLLEILTA
jgi:catechol 2,3-dioxygenase-like lactoylglutathione lyase family enzyme